MIRKFLATAAVIFVSASPVAAAWSEADMPQISPQVRESLKAENRVALVIGNGAYKNEFQPLAKSSADAKAVTAALRHIGFDVTEVVDGTRETIERTIEQTRGKLKDGGIVAVYCSGHSVEFDGEHYIIPVEIGQVRDSIDIRYKALSLSRVTAMLRPAKGALLVFLDDDRSNPFAKGFPGESQSGALGDFSFYGTGPARHSYSGAPDKPLSLFTSHLVPALMTPGVEISEAMRPVIAAVAKESDGGQVPVFYYGLTKPIILLPKE